MRSATGIATATIYEKQIKLPKLPTLKTAMFDVRRRSREPACSLPLCPLSCADASRPARQINDWSSNTSMAQLPESMALLDRHFTSLQGLTKAYIVERYFKEGSDVVLKHTVRRRWVRSELTCVRGRTGSRRRRGARRHPAGRCAGDGARSTR